MSNIIYYTIDVETTGLSSGYHELIEISIIRHSDRVQLSRNIKCENPERSNLDSLRITNKTLADLELGITKERAVEECDKFFNEDRLTPGHRCIVGHNINFDKRFLHAMWAKCNKQFPANLFICTMALSREYAKKSGLIVKGAAKQKVNLHAACDMIGINKIALQHSAKTDSRNTYLLYKALTEEKQINFLPFIKTEAHILQAQTDDEPDMSLLDF